MFDPRARWERLAEKTIARLRTFVPDDGQPYILADSGGKDSCVARHFLRLAKLAYEAHYHVTTIDPPEVVRFIRHEHPETILDKPPQSMAQLIGRRGLPNRWRRWCCANLKERPWPGRTVVTGVRAAESARRATRRMYEPANAGHGQMFLHPLLDWEEADIWACIEAEHIPVVSLYAEGRRRVGCVCCPLAQAGHGRRDAERWPHIQELTAAEVMAARDEQGRD